MSISKSKKRPEPEVVSKAKLRYLRGSAQKVKSHDMEAVRKSIARGIAADRGL